MKRRLLLLLLAWFSAALPARAADEPSALMLHTRSRVEDPKSSGQFEIFYKTVRWDPKQTAVIVCDMWDKHWCKGATGRVVEMAPRMNEFLKQARSKGALIVHAPSGCMGPYNDHPARKRARNAPKADLPGFLRGGGRKLDSEKNAAWPIDQSDGGCDCTPKCPGGGPWRSQIDLLEIRDEDAISDSSIEIGNLFQQRGVRNVMLVGVHTNMCVIGRPFGLRNMVRFGRNVVLVRDLTDTMYNSRRAPLVSHVRGTELIIEYIEKVVCPTITSRELLGTAAFRFREDKRPHVVFVVSDDHYGADKTLPRFAQMLRRRHGCYCTLSHGQGTSNIPGLEELETADVMVLFVRRLALPKAQLGMIRTYLDSGKPLVALRTASHAFDVHGKAPAGAAEWRSFDADVLGGNYHGHGSGRAGTDVAIVPEMAGHPIFAGVKPAKWHSTGSIYNASPINKDAKVLMRGSAGGKTEPIAWVRNYKGGRVFYSSLGHPEDFKAPAFRGMLVGAIFWAMDRPVPEK